MKTFIDDLGRTVTIAYPPKRIISFVPTITSTMYRLNLANEIIGRTRFCKYPEHIVERAIPVGGTKDMKIDRIIELSPDLIIMEKEENTKEMVQQLEAFLPVYVFEIKQMRDALKMITTVGTMTDRIENARQLRKTIETELESLPSLTTQKKAAYVIWQDPYMVVGKNTYIQSVLEVIGFENPFTHLESRYPIVTEEQWSKQQLDYIFLASEPYPFNETHIHTFQKLQPHAEVKLIDGEMFWYGDKMLEAVPYFKQFIAQL